MSLFLPIRLQVGKQNNLVGLCCLHVVIDFLGNETETGKMQLYFRVVPGFLIKIASKSHTAISFIFDSITVIISMTVGIVCAYHYRTRTDRKPNQFIVHRDGCPHVRRPKTVHFDDNNNSSATGYSHLFCLLKYIVDASLYTLGHNFVDNLFLSLI